jgi:oligosaccharide repeat unit polymerase
VIFLYPILFSLLAFRYYKTKQNTPLSLFIVLYYFLSSITANYLYYSNSLDEFENINITLHSVLYHFFCLFLLIEGFYQIEKITEIEFPYVRFSKIFYLLMLLIILSFISIYDSINILKKFSELSVKEIRFAYNEGEFLFDLRTGLLIAYVKELSCILYPICIFFFFYISYYYPSKILFALLLIISSLSIVVVNLTIVGRDSFVQWIIMFVCNYIFFKPLLKTNIKRRILLIGSTIIIIAFIVIVFITLQRFGERPKDVIDNILSYFGQGFINFSKYFELFPDGSFFGRMNFPFLFPIEEQVSFSNLNSTFPTISFGLNVFPTAIGTFYMDFGYIGTIVLSILIFLLLLLIKLLYIKSFTNYFLFIFILQILICGVFWFMQSSTMFQKIFLLLLLISLYKKLMYSLT